MNILSWIILGLIAGWLASVIMNTRSQQGIFADIAFGVLGALVGGFIASLLGLGGVSGFNIASLLIATMGAVVILAAKQQFA